MSLQSDDSNRHQNGSFSENSFSTNSIIGLVIGLVALIIFIILASLAAYFVCCKGRCYNRLGIRNRLNNITYAERTSQNIDPNQQQTFYEPPPSYQERSIGSEINLTKISEEF